MRTVRLRENVFEIMCVGLGRFAGGDKTFLKNFEREICLQKNGETFLKKSGSKRSSRRFQRPRSVWQEPINGL
jgi:hypothetical protein